VKRRGLGTLRVTWLVTALVLRRLVNRFGTIRRRKTTGTSRRATGRKSAAGKLLLGFFGMVFVFQTTTITTRFVHQTARGIEQAELPSVVVVHPTTFEALVGAVEAGACDAQVPPEVESTVRNLIDSEVGELRDPERRERRRVELRALLRTRCLAGFRASALPHVALWPSPEIWYSGSNRLGMPKALALAAVLLSLAVMLQNVAGTGRDLTDVDARFEWLFSFPVPARSLFLSRILAMAFTAPTAWVLLCPFYATVFVCAGFGAYAVPLGVLATLYVGVFSGALRTLLETALPRLLSPPNVARVQAALMLVAYATMLASFATVYSPDADWFLARALALPDAWLYAPLSAPLALTGGARAAAASALVMLACAVSIPFGTVLVAEHLVRGGVVVGTGAYRGARGTPAAAPLGKGLFRGVVKKELRALFRDRQLRTQAFVTPVMIAAFQIWLNPSLLASLGESPRHVATAAFATGMFPLLTGAFGGLAMESNALWLLYTAPVRLERLLASKLYVWVGVAWSFALLVFAGLGFRSPRLVLSMLPYVPFVLGGIFVYAIIALGVGALGTDPLESEARRRIRPSSAYLFMILASLFGYALYSPSLWAKLVQLVLSALLAFALWQKLRDHLPYALDPTEAPPASIAVADGLLAALGFFVFQGLGVLLFGGHEGSMARDLLVAFVWAGGLTALVSVWLFSRSRLPDLLRALGVRAPRGSDFRHAVRALVVGTLGGVAAAAFGLVYQALIVRVPFLERLIEDASKFSREELAGGGRAWFFVLAVGAAPLFEEFIFRGILYTGFRRSIGAVWAAFASALVFALVHPAVSALPVFVMAFFAASVYERFRWLGAPIATHMTYNAVLVGVGLWHTGR
jgi:membrane protease YdiL (CAAX protease family)